MALDLQIEISTIAADCSTITVSDLTGAYDVSTNPGGYGVAGTPNDDRADFALYLYGYTYNAVGDDGLITIDNTSPDTVTDWTIDISADGYVYFIVLAPKVWMVGDTYGDQEIVWISDNYYQSQTAANTGNDPTSDTVNWSVLTETQLIAANADVAAEFQGRLDDVISCNSEICYAKEVSKATSTSCCYSCSTAKRWVKMDTLIQGVYIKCGQAQYTRAHTLITQLEAICEAADCVNCGT